MLTPPPHIHTGAGASRDARAAADKAVIRTGVSREFLAGGRWECLCVPVAVVVVVVVVIDAVCMRGRVMNRLCVS